MKRITNTSKALTSQATGNAPAVPSIGGEDVKVNFRAVPVLSNFLRGHATTELESRKAGKYKLKRCLHNLQNGKCFEIVLTYRLKRTSYKIYSCKKVVPDKGRGSSTNLEGNVIISKGIFQSKKFKLKELPANIVESINNNINKFNAEYTAKLVAEKTSKIRETRKKKSNFFNGLDT